MTLLEQLRASAGDPAVLIDLLARVLMVVAFFGLGNALLRLLASTVKEGAERTVTLVLRVAWSVLSVAALVLVATYTLGLTVAQPLYAWGGGLTGWLESRTVGVLAVVAGAYVALRL
ncbi:MAG TPA: hypothetical protein VNT60_05645, partial [Deinococcales bacterium]|nr:hypothetical protein [Deinococcales bacterium]